MCKVASVGYTGHMIKRLYDTFQPTAYNLIIDIDAKNLTFTGTVTITGRLKQGSATLPLHAKDLTITEAHVNGASVSYQQKPQDVLELQLPETSKEDSVEAVIAFHGVITDDMSGMYPCYFEHEGEKKWLIATQFESHHAREVFPCVDEPAAKATFDVTLTTNEGEAVLSNMPIKDQQIDNSKQITVFETTPRMSTYLLAFVTGEMNHKEAVTKDGVVVRSWASAVQPASHLDYSLQEAVKIIGFFNEYFAIPYPLTKCDQVALPDFDAGAMENWGLITYRESAMLADPENRSISSEQYISTVIAHELSHQWFGNLVTMQWWDDLWLNESFASLMEYIAVDALHPEWQAWEDYTAADAVVASNRDVFSDVQPVRVDVNDPAEISTLFDGAIVYAKGGRLLKMMREYIGEDAFRAGLTSYFKKHAYGNTVRDDLWNELEASSGKPIGTIMNSWLEQSGLPKLQVSQDGSSVQLSQKRLLLDGNDDDTQTWQIPLLANEVLSADLLTETSATVEAESDTAVLFNLSASGHFVVDYEDVAQKQALRDALKDLTIEASGRINTLNDLILLARAGEDSLVSGLELVGGCSNEPRDNVWSLIASILGHARVLTEGDDEAEQKLKDFTYQLVKEQHHALGWEPQDGDDANTIQLRRSLAGLALSSENESVIQEALKRYTAANPADLEAEFRSLLMSAAVRFGDKSEIDKLITLHKETASADIRADVCGALTSTKDGEVGKRLLSMLKDKDHVRPQDLVRWFAYLLRNKHTREITWQWLGENWDWIMETFASSKSYDYFPRYAANFMNSASWLEQYKTFFTPMLSNVSLQRTIKIGVKEIEARIAWRKRDEAKIAEWLRDNSK